ncbi:MAG: hypothetical protein R2856_21860 [Caldilineaceae bacterium]
MGDDAAAQAFADEVCGSGGGDALPLNSGTVSMPIPHIRALTYSAVHQHTITSPTSAADPKPCA